MSKDFENLENENIFSDEESIEFFTKLFEAQSSDIVLPKSLKAENLSKKYEKEIELIKKEAELIQKQQEKRELKPNNMISIFRRKGFAAIAACVAFAGFLFFTSDFAEDNIFHPKEKAEANERTVQGSMYFFNEDADNDKAQGAGSYEENKESAIVNDSEIAAEGSAVMEKDDRSLDIQNPSEEGDRAFDGLRSAPPLPDKETRKAVPDYESSEDISDRMLQNNPATGIDMEANAAKFLISNGAKAFVCDDMVDELPDFAKREYTAKGNMLYMGFLQRLY